MAGILGRGGDRGASDGPDPHDRHHGPGQPECDRGGRPRELAGEAEPRRTDDERPGRRPDREPPRAACDGRGHRRGRRARGSPRPCRSSASSGRARRGWSPAGHAGRARRVPYSAAVRAATGASAGSSDPNAPRRRGRSGNAAQTRAPVTAMIRARATTPSPGTDSPAITEAATNARCCRPPAVEGRPPAPARDDERQQPGEPEHAGQHALPRDLVEAVVRLEAGQEHPGGAAAPDDREGAGGQRGGDERDTAQPGRAPRGVGGRELSGGRSREGRGDPVGGGTHWGRSLSVGSVLTPPTVLRPTSRPPGRDVPTLSRPPWSVELP